MKKKSIARLLRCFITHTLLFTLLVGPSQVMAQQSTMGQLFSTAMDLGNTYLQSLQQTASTPDPAYMSQFAIKRVPAKYFPGCPVPQSKTAFPEKFCESKLKSVQEAQMAQSFIQLGVQYKTFFEKNLKMNQKNLSQSGGIEGMQCLDLAKKELMASLDKRSEYLKGVLDNIKSSNKKFKKMMKKKFDELQDIEQVLVGDPENPGADLGRLFASDQSCYNIIGQANLKSKTTAGGLLGIESQLREHNTKASNFGIDGPQILNNYEKQKKKILSDIKKMGVDNWIASKSGSAAQPLSNYESFTGIAGALTDRLDSFQTDRAAIQRNLSKIPGYKVPNMDADFASNMGDFLERNPEEIFKNNIIDQCVNLSTDDGGGPNAKLAQLLKRVKQVQGSPRGDVVQTYKKKLISILSSPYQTINQQLASIKMIENPNVQLIYELQSKKSKPGNIEKNSIHNYIKIQIANCTQRIQYNYTGTAKSLGRNKGNQESVSNNTQSDISKAVKAISDLKALEATFIDKLAKAMDNKVINCGGDSNFRSNSCSQGDAAQSLFSPSSNNFCFNTANKCVEQVNSCYKKTNQIITDKKNLLNSKSYAYDTLVENYLAKMQTDMKAVIGIETARGERIRQSFTGSGFKLPDDLSEVVAQEEKVSEFIKILGGKDLDAIEELPEKIEELISSTEKQKEAIRDEVDQYMAIEKSSIEAEQEKWQTLVDNCSNEHEEFLAAQKAQYKKQLADRAKRLGKNQGWCAKYNALKNSSPQAGCQMANKLYKDSFKASNQYDIGPEAHSRIQDYNRACGYYKAEQDDRDSDEEETTKTLASMCKTYKKDSSRKVIKILQKKLMKNLPEKLSKSKVKRFLKSKNKDPDDVFTYNELETFDPFIGGLVDLRRLIHPEKEKNSDICKAVTKEKETWAEDNVCGDSEGTKKEECRTEKRTQITDKMEKGKESQSYGAISAAGNSAISSIYSNASRNVASNSRQAFSDIGNQQSSDCSTIANGNRGQNSSSGNTQFNNFQNNNNLGDGSDLGSRR